MKKISTGERQIIFWDELPKDKLKLKGKCPEFIWLYDSGENKRVLAKNILHISGDNSYSTFSLADKKKMLTSKPFNYYEKLLGGDIFFRSHQSHLVNVSYVKRIETRVGGLALLTDDAAIPISRGKKQAFKIFFDGYKKNNAEGMK